MLEVLQWFDQQYGRIVETKSELEYELDFIQLVRFNSPAAAIFDALQNKLQTKIGKSHQSLLQLRHQQHHTMAKGSIIQYTGISYIMLYNISYII